MKETVDIYKCDTCEKVLRSDDIHKRYISIKGTVTVQSWNETEGHRNWTYITDKPGQLLTFCHPEEKECFRNYLDLKEEQRDPMIPKEHLDEEDFKWDFDTNNE